MIKYILPDKYLGTVRRNSAHFYPFNIGDAFGWQVKEDFGQLLKWLLKWRAQRAEAGGHQRPPARSTRLQSMSTYPPPPLPSARVTYLGLGLGTAGRRITLHALHSIRSYLVLTARAPPSFIEGPASFLIPVSTSTCDISADCIAQP